MNADNNPVTGYFTATAKTNYIELGFKPSRVEVTADQTNPDTVTWSTGHADPGGYLTTGSTGVVTKVTTTGISPLDNLPTRTVDDQFYAATSAANSAGDELVYTGHALVTAAKVADPADAFYNMPADMGAGFSVGTAVTGAQKLVFTAWR
jgi:hypothetical protein